ncbi:MAG: cytochrome c oxidase subunit 3 [Alphaproteobacteria bacterium]
MSDAHHPQHDYHLVNPSPWPALGALSGFVLAFGAVMYMHPDMLGLDLGLFSLVPGIMLLLATFYFWWRDVVIEAQQGDHTPVVQLGLRYGMTLFIMSEVMFFVAFFWAFFDASLFVNDPTEFTRTEALGGQWPPVGVETFDPFSLPLLNTLILLTSGVSVTWAHHALLQGNRKALLQGLWITVLLGLIFTCLQAYEYSHAAFGFKDNIYSSTFYMATGFHGFHVIVGTLFLAVCLIRAHKGHFTPTHHFGFEAAAWYWHFVDVVWLFLFVAVYWWGG